MGLGRAAWSCHCWQVGRLSCWAQVPWHLSLAPPNSVTYYPLKETSLRRNFHWNSIWPLWQLELKNAKLKILDNLLPLCSSQVRLVLTSGNSHSRHSLPRRLLRCLRSLSPTSVSCLSSPTDDFSSFNWITANWRNCHGNHCQTLDTLHITEVKK